MSYAILKILLQVKKLKKTEQKTKDVDFYTRVFTKVWSLLCADTIKKRYLEDVAILLTDVDQHWQF